MSKRDYQAINRIRWDSRAEAHAKSPEYRIQQLISEPNMLSKVVQFDLPLLGDVHNLDVIHLQCHIGTDTLSLARLGAKSVTGLDISPKSIAEAEKLTLATRGSGGEKLKYVTSSVYDALDVLDNHGFDLVYTGIGVLCWLHSIREWAKVVAGLLKPGGRLFIREASPILWSLDIDDPGDALKVEFPYFEREEPTVWHETTSYVTGPNGEDLVFEELPSVEFNHGMGEIVQALLDVGMRITGLKEHDTLPWDPYRGKATYIGNGEYRLTDRPYRMPLSYTLQAVKE